MHVLVSDEEGTNKHRTSIEQATAKQRTNVSLIINSHTIAYDNGVAV